MPKPYEERILEMAKAYLPEEKIVVEVGAGFGGFAQKFIRTFMPKKYEAYEFSQIAYESLKNIKIQYSNKTV